MNLKEQQQQENSDNQVSLPFLTRNCLMDGFNAHGSTWVIAEEKFTVLLDDSVNNWGKQMETNKARMKPYKKDQY